ncbi:pesticin C-terminus-like muramidase [Archangium sp. Cb G35]|uniref:pesticin C-terminus-like muramidase n=1 Tax=Archangium sp. Cb G35 TaxID=1920190 RepID=UPI000AF3AF3D|nr:pesticin C-terminus-like muramidase [Archangium sp. Cb G35]
MGPTSAASPTASGVGTAQNTVPSRAPAVNFEQSSFDPANSVRSMPALTQPTPVNRMNFERSSFDPAQASASVPGLFDSAPLNPVAQTFTNPLPALPENFESAFKVPKGQLTFDAEGQEERGRYFSRTPHHPTMSSGVTIGRGYDMKHRSTEEVVADLTAAGVPQADAELLAQGAKLTDQAARDFVNRPDVAAIEISQSAQKNLFNTVYDEHEQDMMRIANGPSQLEAYGQVDWENLDPAILDLAVDLRFRGDYTPLTRKEVQPLIVNNDLQGLYDLFSNEDKMVNEWNVPRDRFEQRRDYLANALAEQAAAR